MDGKQGKHMHRCHEISGQESKVRGWRGVGVEGWRGLKGGDKGDRDGSPEKVLSQLSLEG